MVISDTIVRVKLMVRNIHVEKMMIKNFCSSGSCAYFCHLVNDEIPNFTQTTVVNMYEQVLVRW